MDPKIGLTLCHDLRHILGNIATGSTEWGVALKQAVRIAPYNVKTSLVTGEYLIAQVDTALVRAAYQSALVESATNTALGAAEVPQVIGSIIARLRSENVTAPVAVGLLTTESMSVANERRLRL